jgi:predicted DNA-binding protein with PD1-like motif
VFSNNNIQLKLSKPIEYFTDFEQFKNTNNINFELIFDTNSFSFAEIIYFMEKHKSKNITFKNYISQSNYLIGSNNSTDRGEVLIF